MSKILEAKLDQILSQNHQHGNLLDPSLTMECMEVTITHFMTFTKIIDRKFSHACTALEKRISEIEREQAEALRRAAAAPDEKNVQRLRSYRALDNAFQKLQDAISVAQLGVQDLERIESVFDMLPGRVRAFYNQLVEMDHELTTMIREIKDADHVRLYERAQKIIDLVQGGKDILTGHALVPDEASKHLREVLAPLVSELQKINDRDDTIKLLPDGKIIRE
ncbi:MAG TPA: hypothetical protein VGD95_01470 [Micavibrio sp.]